MVDTTGRLEDGTLITVNGQSTPSGSQDRPDPLLLGAPGRPPMIHTQSGSLRTPTRGAASTISAAAVIDVQVDLPDGRRQRADHGHPRPPIFSFNNTHSCSPRTDVFADNTGMMFQTPGTAPTRCAGPAVSRIGIGAEFLRAATRC